MPELPEVETIARGIAATLEGRRIVSARQNRADLRVPFPPRLVERLTGRRVTHVGRRAKYMLLTLDDGQILIVHLGMSGRFVVRRDPIAPPAKHDHFALIADNGVSYVLNDSRRFGLVALTDTENLETHPLLAGLGPEPLGNAFDGTTLGAALAGRNTPIKSALLDQRVVAGLGNIYVCEALFRSGIDPRRKASTVKGEKAEKLASAIRAVLKDAIAAGGSTLRDFVRHDGELGYFQHHFMVYDRAGKACPDCTCNIAHTGGIKQITQAGRSTFFCPRRQK